MKNYDFDWQINELMIYCRSTQLREKTMKSYEQTRRLRNCWHLKLRRTTTIRSKSL